MSRNSDAKKARRRKRRAARDASWIPAPAVEQILAAEEEFDEIGEAVTAVDTWITARGWVLDTDNDGDHLVSWAYPPSAAEVDDEHESVTRIWIAIEEDDDALVLEFGAAMVGAGPDDEDGLILIDPESLPEDIAVLEAFRHGQPWPVLG